VDESVDLVTSEPMRVSTKYCLNLTKDEMQRIFKNDEDNWNQSKRLSLSTLMDEYDKVYNVDYGSHTGTSFYYSVKAEHDKKQTHARVRTIIRRYIR
jgi:ABC-type phosphate transport system substrate-binding protein